MMMMICSALPLTHTSHLFFCFVSHVFRLDTGTNQYRYELPLQTHHGNRTHRKFDPGTNGPAAGTAPGGQRQSGPDAGNHRTGLRRADGSKPQGLLQQGVLVRPGRDSDLWKLLGAHSAFQQKLSKKPQTGSHNRGVVYTIISLGAIIVWWK